MLSDKIKLDTAVWNNVHKKAWISMTARLSLISALAIIGAIGFSQPVYADAYMDALQSEASGLEVLGKAKEEHKRLLQQAEKQRKSTPKKQLASRKPHKDRNPISAADRKRFENELKNQFPSSYALYVQLSPQNKTAIAHTFNDSDRHGLVRYLAVITKIVNLSVDK